MTPQGRAGKRRRKGAGKPCRENGAPNINWSKWPVDVVNDTKRHSPEKTLCVTDDLDLTLCQATVKSGKWTNCPLTTQP